MRTIGSVLVVLHLAACSSAPAALWRPCTTDVDGGAACPAGFGCGTGGVCQPFCASVDDCERAYGAHGTDSEAMCTLYRPGCRVGIDPGCTCVGTDEGCEAPTCALTGCNDDSDCAGGRCAAGQCVAP
jgi:hypothetical protein